MAVRVLSGPASQDLAELYATPADHVGPWLRVNFVSTVDGAAQGEDGRSGGINNAADKVVFDELRAMADVLVVGAGTLRTEGYDATSIPLVVVSRSGQVPDKLRGAAPGRVLMATTSTAPGLAEARRLLGDDHLLVLGEDEVDLVALKAELAGRGWTEQLSEGGPSLFRAMLAAGVVDELCLTTVPRLIAGGHLRVVAGPAVDVPLELALLLEEQGTLLARWLVAGE